MSSDEKGAPPRRLQREVASRRIAELSVVTDEIHESLTTSGDVPENLRKRLHNLVLSAVFELHPARDEQVIDWEEIGPFDGPPETLLKDAFHGDVQERVPSNRHNPEPERTRAPARIDIWTLYETAIDLRDAAYELGLMWQTDPSQEPIHADPV